MNQLETHLHACDFCQQETHCRNLFVATKILEEELRFVGDRRLSLHFENLRQQVARAGYAFPESIHQCTLAQAPGMARDLLEKAQEILRELRQKLRLSSPST